MHHPMYNYIQWMGAALETSNVCRMEDIDAERPAMLRIPKKNPVTQVWKDGDLRPPTIDAME